MSKEKIYLIEVVSGKEGPSIYMNDYRMAGPKPWGGGNTISSFIVRESDLQSGMFQSLPNDERIPLVFRAEE